MCGSFSELCAPMNEFLHIRFLVLFLALSNCSLNFSLSFLFSPLPLLHPSFLYSRNEWHSQLRSVEPFPWSRFTFFFFFSPHHIPIATSQMKSGGHILWTHGSLRITFAQKTWEPPKTKLWSYNQEMHAGITQMWTGIQGHLPGSHANDVCSREVLKKKKSQVLLSFLVKF